MNVIDFQKYTYYSHAVTIGGKVLEIPLRSGEKDSAFIDALTFTVHKQTIDVVKGICINDNEYAAAYSEILIEIFGFGITEKRPGRGRYLTTVTTDSGPKTPNTAPSISAASAIQS